tara:strand:+ start:719 stop:1165 length:447 start_codon:yes stop_codon:yes gene_type:complete
MKKLFFSFALLFGLVAFVNAQEVSGSGPEISFEKEVHNFGNLKQNGDASTEFKFTNTGTEPLIISNARGSCGCTVPSWPKEPILPGKSAVIKVKYDSKRVGPINKSVTISSNATNTPTKVIRIKGSIEAAPKEETMPVNKSEGAPIAQ